MTLLVLAAGAAGQPTAVAPPANAPAEVKWDAGVGKLTLRYHGGVILDATVRAADAAENTVGGSTAIKLEQPPATVEKDKVEQRLRFTLAEPKDGVKLVVSGSVTGSEEAFPTETTGEAQQRFPLVRNSVGLSRNLRNNAVYDRRWDWLLAGPADGTTHLLPKPAQGQGIPFAWESRPSAGSGPAIVELVFRPRFYQKHRNVEKFEPWTYQVWKGPVTGYCTWWAYKYDFTQKTLDALTDVFAQKKLPDFGYKYIQLDDTYQTGNGSCPQNWLTWNQKFPGGAEYALNKIKSAGMAGGIWVHRVHRPNDLHVADIGKQHPDWFVHKPDGSLFMDGGFYILNTRNKEAIDGMVRPIYRELRKQGWGYVKIDGAGDLLGCYKSKQCEDHFKKIGSTPEESLRDWDRVAREELGKGTYILNCWGVNTGLCVVGLADGCRLAGDGFQPETLANNSSYEGVVWRNDPDHCDILGSWLMDEKASMPVFGSKVPVPVRTVVRPAICSIAGSVLMVSDKVEVYQDDVNLEGMKRSAPVLPTVPGQIYDPGHQSDTWWLQEIDRPFDHWSVLSRIQWAQKREKEWVFDLKGVPQQEVKFADLGLEADREYVVFEFWTQKFLGKAKGSFSAPAMDGNNGMQVFAIREAREYPWVLSTTRHISQGGVCLLDEKWDKASNILSGKSAVVAGDPYVLTVHLPAGFKLKAAEVNGEKAETASQAETASLRIVPAATKTLEWKMVFAK
ncbi:MAG: alpha-galactosidase [Verrucomicrobiota bacterium]